MLFLQRCCEEGYPSASRRQCQTSSGACGVPSAFIYSYIHVLVNWSIVLTLCLLRVQAIVIPVCLCALTDTALQSTGAGTAVVMLRCLAHCLLACPVCHCTDQSQGNGYACSQRQALSHGMNPPVFTGPWALSIFLHQMVP